MKVLLHLRTWVLLGVLGTFAAPIVTFASAPVLSRSEKIEFTLKNGTPITAEVRIPIGEGNSSEKKAYPTVIVFGGFRDAARVLSLIRTDVPLVLASFDYPFSPPRKFVLPQSLALAPDVKRMFGDTIEAVGLLVKHLSARPEVDRARISILGASFGAPFAMAAAVDSVTLQSGPISGLILVHGFGDLRRTAIRQMVKSWEPRYGIWAHIPAWLIATAGWLYFDAPEPEDLALRLNEKQRVLMVQAAADSFIPGRSSQVLWSALENSKAKTERVLMPGDHVQPGSDRLISEILVHIQGWMRRMDLLP